MGNYQQERGESNAVDVRSIMSDLLSQLTDREHEVVRRRYGINSDRDTLEKIGQEFGVTRERVRQIEIGSIKKLRKLDQFDQIVEPLAKEIHKVIDAYGGILENAHLLEILNDQICITDEDHNTVCFIAAKLLNDRIESVNKHKHFRNGWKIREQEESNHLSRLGQLIDIIKSHGEPIALDDLHKVYHEKHSDDVLKDSNVFHSLLRSSNKLDQNIFGEWGIHNWNTIRPKRMNDKIYIVLKKQEKPLHFCEIAEKINEMKFDSKVAYPATVHNELILDKKYVLVGRGIYALVEWGYKHGVVADVIAEILKESGAMTREAIVDEVLKQRIVGKSTIHLSLMNKKRFQKLDNGKFDII